MIIEQKTGLFLSGKSSVILSGQVKDMDKIPNWLIKRAYLTPDRTALIWKDKKITFQTLFQEAGTMAKKLCKCGIKKGDHIAIFLTNQPETVVLLHALQLVGCTAVLLNIRLQKQELAFQLWDSDSRYIITKQELLEKLPGETNVSIITLEQLQEAEGQDFEPVTEFALDEPCTIMYTSGTTGKPKGVLHTYGNHWSSAIASVLNLGLKESDVWLTAVPLFHISGYSTLIRSAVYGIPVFLFERFDENKINEALIQGKATIMSVVSTMLQRMLGKLGQKSYHPSFRCFLLGGGPVPKNILETCKEKNIPVFQTYGLTETASQIATLSPEDSLRKIGSAGKPLFLSSIRIERDGKPAKPNEAGEIVVKGPNVTSGYYKREEANKESFTEDGWFYTGDLGYMDEEGFLYVLDRRTDLIISGGENIYPSEIESVIQSHPAILEACVVGRDDEKWGQVPCAFYVTKENKNVTGEELSRYCSDYLAKYKIPKTWIPVPSLPKTASNKIMRRELRKRINR